MVHNPVGDLESCMRGVVPIYGYVWKAKLWEAVNLKVSHGRFSELCTAEELLALARLAGQIFIQDFFWWKSVWISSKKEITAFNCINIIAIFEDEMKHHWKHDKCQRFNYMSNLSAENSPSCEGNIIFQHLQGIAGKYPLCFNRRFKPSQLTKMFKKKQL